MLASSEARAGAGGPAVSEEEPSLLSKVPLQVNLLVLSFLVSKEEDKFESNDYKSIAALNATCKDTHEMLRSDGGKSFYDLGVFFVAFKKREPWLQFMRNNKSLHCHLV